MYLDIIYIILFYGSLPGFEAGTVEYKLNTMFSVGRDGAVLIIKNLI